MRGDRRPTHSPRRAVLRVLAGLTVMVLALILAFAVSPWPGAMIVRLVFHRDAVTTTQALQRHAPADVTAVTDQRYREGDDDAFLDVYVPSGVVGTDRALPTVIWTHGGAWISGSRTDYAPYYQLIADAGFTVVSVDYTRGPEGTYPRAVHQLRDAHAYLLANADRLHIDPDRIVLAGDSAGSQLSSQMAAIATNPEFASQVGVRSALRPDQLRGVVLNCGIYDVPAMAGGSGLVGWGVNQSLWAYTGSRTLTRGAAVSQMSTLHHVTAAFPPTYLSGGNADPLTDTQSRPFAARLTELGVDVTTLFFPPDHRPALAHEYQFDLDDQGGQTALRRTIEFLQTHTRP